MNCDLTVSAKLKIISTAYERVLNNHIQNLELTSSQAHIITLLTLSGGKAICQKDIEKVLGFKHPTVTGLISRMESKGFVSLHQGDSDKRCKVIELTQKGKDAFEESRRLVAEVDSELFSNISEKELASLNETLDKIIANAKQCKRIECKRV